MRQDSVKKQNKNRTEPTRISRYRISRFASAFAVGALVCCAVLVFTVRAYNRGIPKPADTAAARPVNPNSFQGPPASQGGSVELIQFTLYDVGIYPREAHVSKGLIMISIEDLSGGTTGLVVERENGNAGQRVGSVERSDHHWRGRNQIQLEPGRYRVYMADRPDNRAVLNVEQ